MKDGDLCDGWKASPTQDRKSAEHLQLLSCEYSYQPTFTVAAKLHNGVCEFILFGLTQVVLEEKIGLVVFSSLYLGTLLANSLILITIRHSQTLGPMHFFLFYLSFADACFLATTAPRLIIDAVSEKKLISYNECVTQIFALPFFGCMEIFVLILMALDCYVAICKPLRYTTIMSQRVCVVLVTLAWVGSCIHSSAQTFLALRLPFCGPSVIDHYFCDLQPLLKLACMDAYVINLLVVSNSGAICVVSFIMLLISYIVILYSLRNHSTERRRKALSTCTSHFTVVVIFFGPCIFIYTRPPTTFPVDKMVAVFYTISTPLLNPLIYTLRNAEVKSAVKKGFSPWLLGSVVLSLEHHIEPGIHRARNKLTVVQQRGSLTGLEAHRRPQPGISSDMGSCAGKLVPSMVAVRDGKALRERALCVVIILRGIAAVRDNGALTGLSQLMVILQAEALVSLLRKSIADEKSSLLLIHDTMLLNNNVTEFILLGLTQDPVWKKIVFVIFLLFYLGTLLGNLLIIATIKTSRALGSPMYFFLFYLSLSDICLSTSIAPRVIVDSLSKKNIISFSECMIQVFSTHFFGCLEIFILILMAVDRYVAICRPLHYTTIMNPRVCGVLVAVAWVGSCVHSLVQIFLALSLPFCGPNVIDHYFCDLEPLLELACADTYLVNLLLVSNGGAICLVSFVLLMFSYVVILHSLRNHSAEGRRKALSTCISHIIIVVLTFALCVFIYTRPAITFPMDKVVAVFYTIGTPLLNPLIYTLRNAEVKNAMNSLWSKKSISGVV
ncbi:LOW QUALITY PROTEIN: uncharacterized protein O8D03_013247 [Erethizon dorsatum]